MKILFANIFSSYTFGSIVDALRRMGCDAVEKTYYTPEDVYEDHRLYDLLEQDVKGQGYDAVFTVNIWPIVARCCNDLRTPYVAWSYDSPQNLPTTKDLDYDTNFLFLFDRAEVEIYRKEGIERVYHLPLAADVQRWDAIRSRLQTEGRGAAYDVSLVGSLYESTLPGLLAGMNEYHRGYIQAVIEAQKKIYGYFLVDDLLTEEWMQSFNEHLGSRGTISSRQLSYSMATYITFMERLTLLHLLGDCCEAHLFTSDIKEEIRKLLQGVFIHGWASYDEQMPMIFMQSKINLNPALKIIRSGIPLRCMDIMGCGGFLLSSYQPELAEYFIPDEEVVLYDSIEDAVEKALFYLRNDELRQEIAYRGYERVKADFSYEKQLGKILDIVRA